MIWFFVIIILLFTIGYFIGSMDTGYDPPLCDQERMKLEYEISALHRDCDNHEVEISLLTNENMLMSCEIEKYKRLSIGKDTRYLQNHKDEIDGLQHMLNTSETALAILRKERDDTK